MRLALFWTGQTRIKLRKVIFASLKALFRVYVRDAQHRFVLLHLSLAPVHVFLDDWRLRCRAVHWLRLVGLAQLCIARWSRWTQSLQLVWNLLREALFHIVWRLTCWLCQQHSRVPTGRSVLSQRYLFLLNWLLLNKIWACNRRFVCVLDLSCRGLKLCSLLLLLRRNKILGRCWNLPVRVNRASRSAPVFNINLCFPQRSHFRIALRSSRDETCFCLCLLLFYAAVRELRGSDFLVLSWYFYFGDVLN